MLNHMDIILNCPCSTLRTFFKTTREARLLAATGYEHFTGFSLKHWTLKDVFAMDDNRNHFGFSTDVFIILLLLFFVFVDVLIRPAQYCWILTFWYQHHEGLNHHWWKLRSIFCSFLYTFIMALSQRCFNIVSKMWSYTLFFHLWQFFIHFNL